MRPKVVIVILLAGIVGIMAFFFLKAPAIPPQMAEIPTSQVTAPIPEPTPVIPQTYPVTNKIAAVIPVKPANPAPVVPSEAEAEEAAAKVQEQINRLVDLQSNNDDASLRAILKELTNTNPIIRHEAIEATIQFGGHTAVPVLQDLAAHTVDPDEKKELLEAAGFLALPTLTETKEQAEQEKLKGNPPPQ